MKASGSTTKPKVLAATRTLTAHFTRVSGTMINNTDTELSHGLMARVTTDNTLKARRKVAAD